MTYHLFLKRTACACAVLAACVCPAPKLASAKTLPNRAAIKKDECIGQCAASCQQMVIWYWYRRYGKEALYLRQHDISRPLAEPVSVDRINYALNKASIPVVYAEYKAEYDPETGKIKPIRWDVIIDSLNAGRPAIYFSDVGNRAVSAHAIMLTSYNKKLDMFTANDTYFKRVPVAMKNKRLAWSKKKIAPVAVSFMGDENHFIGLFPWLMDKHKRTWGKDCLLIFSPVNQPNKETTKPGQ